MKALFAGSFHPPTRGHIDIVRRAARLFEEVYVAVMINAQKVYTIPAEARVSMFRECLKDVPNVTVLHSDGLTAQLAKSLGVGVLIRGVRDSGDFEYEIRQAEINHQLTGVETLMLPADARLSALSSSVVMDIAKHGGDISAFVPPEIANEILTYISKGE